MSIFMFLLSPCSFGFSFVQNKRALAQQAKRGAFARPAGTRAAKALHSWSLETRIWMQRILRPVRYSGYPGLRWPALADLDRSGALACSLLNSSWAGSQFSMAELFSPRAR